MTDDIVTVLSNIARDRIRHGTHYEGCHEYHIECAALLVCAEIERLRERLTVTDDIVQELRDWAMITEEIQGKAVLSMLSGQIFTDAANEIERLRSSVVLCPQCINKEKDND